MEKYGIAEDDMITGLRDEEHNLMLQMGQYMGKMEKSAYERSEMQQIESRLHSIRAKITEHDLKKIQEHG